MNFNKHLESVKLFWSNLSMTPVAPTSEGMWIKHSIQHQAYTSPAEVAGALQGRGKGGANWIIFGSFPVKG